MSFVVEVSNPRLANDTTYERWEPLDEVALAERLEEELGWSPATCRELAEIVVAGEDFGWEDVGTGRTVTAYRRSAAVAGRRS